MYLLCSQWSVVEVMIAASSKDLIQVLPLVRRNTMREPRVKTSEAVLGGWERSRLICFFSGSEFTNSFVFVLLTMVVITI